MYMCALYDWETKYVHIQKKNKNNDNNRVK